ncbi:MAG: hypothetical protein A2Y90_06330 [Chloroflexi bacterium RBG_13_52_12]|nr:MAG: hypothetical protein A2Y90_06330 [Chloroflexi bacterium RBG_13_52_12]
MYRNYRENSGVSEQSFIPGNTDTVNIDLTPRLSNLNAQYFYDYTFVFTSLQTVSVNVKLDGQDWSGPVAYTVQGPHEDSGTTAPQIFEEMPAGDYSLTYQSGGPAGAILDGITPSTINLSGGQSGTFTMNFITLASIDVAASLDGQPWSGNIDYSIEGPKEATGTNAPQSYHDILLGLYTVKYNSGGPSDARFMDITPADTEDITNGENAAFTLNFQSFNKLNVLATLNGQPWNGNVSYAVSGLKPLSGLAVSQSFSGLPPGQYSLSYISGGPANAVLSGISPAASQDVSSTGEVNFTLEFTSTGTITVYGWVFDVFWSGPCIYTVQGPVTLSGTSLPQTFSDVPVGEYFVDYISDGPPDGYYYLTVPETQKLSTAGENILFDMYFYNWRYFPGHPYFTSIPVTPVIPAVPAADLSVTAIADNYTPGGGWYYNYIITITNSGPDAASGIQVKFLVSGLDYVNNTPSQGSYNSGTGIWSVGGLASGSSATLTVHMGVSTVTGTVITYTAELITVVQADPDSVPNNGNPAEDDQASVTIVVS